MPTKDAPYRLIGVLAVLFLVLTSCDPDPDLKSPAIPLQLFEQIALQKEITQLKAQEATDQVLFNAATTEETGQTKGQDDTPEAREEEQKQEQTEAGSRTITARIALLEDSLKKINEFLLRETNPAGALPVPPLCLKGPACPSPCQEAKDCDIAIPAWANILIQEQAGFDAIEIKLTTPEGKVLGLSNSTTEGTYKKLSSTGYALTQIGGLEAYAGPANISVSKMLGGKIVSKLGLRLEFGPSLND